jgi:hypothetical protein
MLSFIGQAGLFEFLLHQGRLEITCHKVEKREMDSISLGLSGEMTDMISG